MAIELPPNANNVLLGQALGQLGQNLVAGYIQKAEQMKEATDSQSISGWLSSLKDNPNAPAPTGMVSQKGKSTLDQLNFQINNPVTQKNLELVDSQILENKSQAKLREIKLSGQPQNIDDFGTGLEKIVNPKMRQMYIDTFLPKLDPDFASSKALAEQAFRIGSPTPERAKAIEDFRGKYGGLYEASRGKLTVGYDNSGNSQQFYLRAGETLPEGFMPVNPKVNTLAGAKIADVESKTDVGYDTAEEAIANVPKGADGKPLLVKSVKQNAYGKYVVEFGDRTAGMGSQTSQYLPGAGTFQMPDPKDPTKMVPAAINKITLLPEPMLGIQRPEKADIIKQKEIRGLEDFNSKLDRINTLFSNHKDYVGPIRNIQKGVQEKYTGELGSEENEFRQLVKELSDDLLRLRSGAQINEQEYQRMLGFLPTTNLPANTFRDRLNSVKKTMIGKFESRGVKSENKNDFSSMSDEELRQIANGEK
jgi:hypothetical protein